MAGVLLLGNLRASLTLARKLHAAGWMVHCGVDGDDPYLSFSRAVAGAFRHPPLDIHPDLALDDVLGYLARHPHITAVIPVSEVATRIVSRRRDRFDASVRLLMAEDAVVELCADKARLFRLCDQLGVRLARRIIVESHAALQSAVEAMGRPCVVKPVESTELVFGTKALILGLNDDAAEVLPGWPPGHRTLCVQSFVDGPRVNVYFGATEGRLLGAAAVEIARTDRWDGTGYAVEGVSTQPSPALRHASEALVQAVGYTGVGCLQFMVDRATGEISFLEINPRLGANYAIAEACGLPLSLWMVQIVGGCIDAETADAWSPSVGRRYVWSKGDLAGLKREHSAGRLTPTQAAAWAFRALLAAASMPHLTFDPRDPAPTLWIYLHPLLRRLGFGRKHPEITTSSGEDSGPATTR